MHIPWASTGNMAPPTVRYATQLCVALQVAPAQSELAWPALPPPPIHAVCSIVFAAHAQQPVYTTLPPQ